MKKVLVMSALVAFSTAFVACSSDDDLVQQKPDVPEESVEDGIPMTVKVADLASRGTDLTTSTLEGFTLYSTMTPAWTTGKLFGKDAGGNWTTNTDLAWPDKETYTFFGISDVDNFADITGKIEDEKEVGDGHPDAPIVTSSTCSFNYAMPRTLKPGSDDEYYYNSEDLKDLLVAKTTCSSESGDPKGTLEVDFQHALAQIKAIQIYTNITRLGGFTGFEYYRFRIGGIRIGGLKTVGTYTFDAADPWAVTGADAEFEIPLDQDVVNSFAASAFSFKETKTLTLTDGGLYLIPQAAAGALTDDATYTGGGEWAVKGPYAELDIQVFFYTMMNDYTSDPDGYAVPDADDEEVGGTFRVAGNVDNTYLWCGKTDPLAEEAEPGSTSDDAGYGKVRVPLKFQKLEGGKGYTLKLDLSRAVIYEIAGDPGYTRVNTMLFAGFTPTAG